jgi:hypothetical protein
MTGFFLSLIFAGFAASMAWHSGKRGLSYLKTGRDFVQFDSTKASGQSFLLAGTLWTVGAIVMGIITLSLLGLAVYYLSIL